MGFLARCATVALCLPAALVATAPEPARSNLLATISLRCVRRLPPAGRARDAVQQQVNIVRPRMPSPVRLAVITREIFATHYRNASLGLTAVTEDAAGQRYLVYVNRSQLDLLSGVFGGWKRALVEGKLKSESASVFNEVRRRLESGPPPE